MRKKYYNPNIPAHLHERMKRLAELDGRPIIRHYEEALVNYIANKNQEILLADSRLEAVLLDTLNKGIERLAAMQARNGMDISITLFALLHFLSREYGIEENKIYEQIRPAAAKYFSRPLRDQHEEPRKYPGYKEEDL